MFDSCVRVTLALNFSVLVAEDSKKRERMRVHFLNFHSEFRPFQNFCRFQNLK